MGTSRDIQSWDEIGGRLPEFVRQLKGSGEPIRLTVDGEAVLIVQDAESYRRLEELAEEGRAVEGIRRGLADIDAGRVQPIDEAFDEIGRELDLPPSP